MRLRKLTLKHALVAGIVLLLVSLAINSLFVRMTCSYYGYQTARDTRYAMFVGCMVKVQDTWIPRHELRVVQ